MVDEKKVNQVVDRVTTPADPVTAHADPVATPAGPVTVHADPVAAPADPEAAPAGPKATPAGPEATPLDPEDTPGWELPLLLFAGFRSLIDRLHARLATEGHPGLRPAYGFAMQAIGPAGTTAGELGRRLGVSKQAAGKTADRLAALGYVTAAADPSDARRKLLRLTPHGLDALTRSAELFETLRAEWAGTVGAGRVRDLEAVLRAVVPPNDRYRVDPASWLGG